MFLVSIVKIFTLTLLLPQIRLKVFLRQGRFNYTALEGLPFFVDM